MRNKLASWPEILVVIYSGNNRSWCRQTNKQTNRQTDRQNDLQTKRLLYPCCARAHGVITLDGGIDFVCSACQVE